MNNRLLVYMHNDSIEYDIYNTLDYSNLHEKLIEQGYTSYPNFENTDYINDNYDAVLMPCANIFSEEFVDKLKMNTEFYNIPTVTSREISNYKNIYELYEKIDYTDFNIQFSKNKILYKAIDKALYGYHQMRKNG